MAGRERYSSAVERIDEMLAQPQVLRAEGSAGLPVVRRVCGQRADRPRRRDVPHGGRDFAAQSVVRLRRRRANAALAVRRTATSTASSRPAPKRAAEGPAC